MELPSKAPDDAVVDPVDSLAILPAQPNHVCDHELKFPRHPSLASFSPSSPIDRDVLALARAGKKAVLARRFGLLSMTGFACSLMLTWESMLINLLIGLENGGPAGLIYGYLLSWAGSISTFIVIAELASMLPTAAGQYHWAHMLAPVRVRSFVSYVTGWITIAAWISTAAASTFYVSTLLQTIIAQGDSGYEPARWQATLLMWAVLAVCVLFSTAFGTLLPVIEVLVLILHITGFFGTLVPLVALAPPRTPAPVWTEWYNYSGWSSQGLAFMLCVQGNAVAFIGADSAAHMAEEVENAAVNVPRAIVLAVLINGALGFAMLLALLYSFDSLQSVVRSGTTYPVTHILDLSMESNAAATVLISVILFVSASSIIASLSSTARIMWAFARDETLPGWRVLRRINRRTSIPTNTVYVTVAIVALLALINVASSVAFNVVVALLLTGCYTSYLLAIGCLLYRRLRGDIQEPHEFDYSNANDTATGRMFVWGPWRLKGWLGTANHIFAFAYLIVVAFFGYWPPMKDVDAERMNYACVIMGGVVIFSVGWYVFRARKTYKGPLVEVEISVGN